MSNCSSIMHIIAAPSCIQCSFGHTLPYCVTGSCTIAPVQLLTRCKDSCIVLVGSSSNICIACEVHSDETYISAEGTEQSLGLSLTSRRSQSLGSHLASRGSEGTWDRAAASAAAAATAPQQPPSGPPARFVFINVKACKCYLLLPVVMVREIS